MSKIASAFIFLALFSAEGQGGRTAEADIVVVVQLVDRLKLSTDVVFLDLGVQVLDSGVLWVTTEDELGFLRPKVGR